MADKQSNFTPEQISEILELFFENLAHRQYIGARYVPIFGRKGETSIIWDGGANTYEPLTIVLYQGNSYTSRQYVPVGIDITNNEYWAETGNYNAQVEQYRQEVLTFSDDIETLKTDVSSVKTDLSDFETDVAVQFGTQWNNMIEMVGTETTNRELADDELRAEIKNKVVTVDSYGAKGDGVTDCTAAIQQAIDENPNSRIAFKGGVYCISNTVFLNGDNDSTLLDLCGSTVKWIGTDSVWAEGQAVSIYPNHDGICSNPHVMFAVERRVSTSDDYSPGRPGIINGSIDANYKADIAIQSVTFVPMFVGLRIMNFQYAGILNGTMDGKTYENGVVASDSSASTQAVISDCYFTRGGNMSLQPCSAIMITFPDNQIDNCVTNRTMYGITLRCGGNSISNTHITIQYATFPAGGSYDGANIRIWPFSAGMTQLNVFDNMYFNAGRYVFYAYHSSDESYTAANIRTMVTNSHYTFYVSNQFNNLYNCYWWGGMFAAPLFTNQCGFLYADKCNMHLWAPPTRESLNIASWNEFSIANASLPHENGRMWDASNYKNGEYITMNTGEAPLVAGNYKCVAIIDYTYPVSDANLAPGMLEIEYSMENAGFYKKQCVIRTGNDYAVELESSHGTSGMKLYIDKTERTYTLNGVTHYYNRVLAYTTSNVTDARFIKITPSSPYVKIYGFPRATNFTSGLNQNIFSSATTANLVELN